MKPTPHHILVVYLVLLLLNTLAASLIWGIDTLFLLGSGLSNTQVFITNAFFTLGQVVFEVPTGMVADVKGRRVSYLLGTVTLALSTLGYLLAGYFKAPLPVWTVASLLLGLGFTFFSGATEAWLVDALKFSGFKGNLDDVFAKGQMVRGAAMLLGSVGGGVLAQYAHISVPYIVRAVLLLLTTVLAFIYMKDWGFEVSTHQHMSKEIKRLFSTSINLGFKNPAIRWLMLAAPFSLGVSFYTFYAMQPFLLQLYQNDKAYGIAGLAAAIVAGSQIVGGLLVPYVKKISSKPSVLLLVGIVANGIVLAAIGSTSNFWMAIGILCLWGLLGAALQPIRQSYLNSLIPSQQRATVLSFDSLVASSGGIFIQPTLGKIADLKGYGLSFVGGAVFQVLALPFATLLLKEDKTNSKKV